MSYYQSGIYFLTGSTFLHYPYFKTSQQKDIVYDRIAKLKEKYGVTVSAYSIQINHYHLIVCCDNDQLIPKIKQFIHGGVSKNYRDRFSYKYKEMWGNAKTVYIKDMNMYWGIAGYVCGNLLKHKEVNKISDLRFNRYCSYEHFVGKYGEEKMRLLIYNVLQLDENKEDYSLDIGEMARLKPRHPS
ncbi:MAG: transposase [Candidatus Magasanikbacteria bacterium]